MTDGRTISPAQRTLRLWPGLTIAVALGISAFVLPVVVPAWAGTSMIASVLLALAIVLWWLFFSRASWTERLGALVVMVGAVAAVRVAAHASIATGFMGFMPYLFAVPLAALGLVAGAAAGRRLVPGRRLAAVSAGIVLGCAALTAVRTDGVTGDGASELQWRWTPTAEERLLARQDEEVPVRAAASEARAETSGAAPPPAGMPSASSESSASPSTPPGTENAASAGVERRPGAAADMRDRRAIAPLPEDAPSASAAAPRPVAWPGFRGRDRNSVVRGPAIAIDWTRAAPKELWRRPVGPGWSSFAVGDSVFYTQEQRGDEEIVAAYELTTGRPVWRHRDAARFWESNAGAGPRATPTLHDGRLYTFGATGILNALDARDGSVIWTRQASADTGRKMPDWGFASSPLVVGDMVVAATAGVLAAYDRATGEPRWIGPKGGWGYSSPHLATIDGVTQIVLLNGAGAIGVSPQDGSLLWQHEWQGDGIVQPAVLGDGDVIVGSGSGMAAAVGLRRLSLDRRDDGWRVQERWTSRGLKPYFSDFVIHQGHAYGFDGSILSCVDIADGTRTWKGGRYGQGQMVLLPEQDVLLVVSEDGELVLVRAAPDGFAELARAPAIEGKTWNHPALAGDILLVRNGHEMAAFRLPMQAP